MAFHQACRFILKSLSWLLFLVLQTVTFILLFAPWLEVCVHKLKDPCFSMKSHYLTLHLTAKLPDYIFVLQLAYCLQSLRFPQLQHLFVVPVISAFLVTHIPAICQLKAISGASLVPVGNLIPLTANCSSHPLQNKPNRKIPFAETHLCHLHSWVNLRFLLRLALRSP